MNNDYENENEIIEITSDLEPDEPANLDEHIKEAVKAVKTNKKRRLKKWNDFTKKQKITIISIGFLVICLIVGLIIILTKKKKEPTPSEPMVIVKTKNYRYENGKLFFLDSNGKDLGEYECTNKDNNLCFVAYFTPEEQLDFSKVIYEDGTLYKKRSSIYNDNFVFIFDNEKADSNTLKLYNIANKKEEDTYDGVKEYRDNEVIVSKNSKYGVLSFNDSKVSESLNLTYDYLGTNKNEYLVFKTSKGFGIMDKNKEELASKIKYEIKSYDENYIAVKNNENYYLYDYDGVKQDLKDAEFISFKDSYIVFIADKKLSIYDNKLNLLNISSIKLDSTDYNKITIVDDKDKVIETKESFVISVENDTIKVTDSLNKETVINKYEGLISGNYEYVSYNNNSLYFYKDKEKKTLLGEYSCKSSNNVTSSSNSFDNCFIAKETILLNRKESAAKAGYIPIYNGKYAFIYDDGNIILYDILNKNKLSNYTKVDVGYYSLDDKINIADANNIMIMASKNDGTSGIITINSLKATGVVPFKASSIKYLDDSTFIVKYTDNYYHLWTTKGEEITKNITTNSEIVKYNEYEIMIKDGTTYQLYNIATGKIDSAKLKYIDLQKEVYVGIDDQNKLNVYSYKKPNQKLFCQDIEIDNASNLNEAYKLTYYSDSLVSIKVNSTNKTYTSDDESLCE